MTAEQSAALRRIAEAAVARSAKLAGPPRSPPCGTGDSEDNADFSEGKIYVFLSATSVSTTRDRSEILPSRTATLRSRA
jgi:hypothetical protein